MSISPSPLSAKPAEDRVPKARRDLVIKKEDKTPQPDWRETLQLEIGAHFSPIFPLGNLGTIFDRGIGGSVFASMDFPYLINTRIGGSIGYARMNSKKENFDASISISPILLFFESLYIFDFGLRPYIRGGAGITMASYTSKDTINNKTSSINSIEPIFSVGTGVGYRNRKIPHLEVLLYANYFLALEQNPMSFVLVSLGFTYIF